MRSRFLPVLAIIGLLSLEWGGAVVFPYPAAASVEIAIENDPHGFHGIPWGASLANNPDFTLVTSSNEIKEYELKNGPPPLGEARVDSMRFTTIEGQFARVTIRYRGQKTHDQVLAYLQATFGQTDRTQGSMMRGLNQQFNWRGTDTEVNLTYEGAGERGYLFIESRMLAGKFNEHLPTTYRGRLGGPASRPATL